MKPSDRYDSLIEYYSRRVDLPWRIIKRQVMQESAANPRAVSSCGAIGLLQLMPATAREMKCLDPWNPEENLRAGTEYLARQEANVRSLVLQGGSSIEHANILRFSLAAYNGGWGYVRAALRTLMDKDETMTWENFAPRLTKVIFRGKRPDHKQIIHYVEKILPPGETVGIE